MLEALKKKLSTPRGGAGPGHGVPEEAISAAKPATAASGSEPSGANDGSLLDLIPPTDETIQQAPSQSFLSDLAQAADEEALARDLEFDRERIATLGELARKRYEADVAHLNNQAVEPLSMPDRPTRRMAAAPTKRRASKPGLTSQPSKRKNAHKAKLQREADALEAELNRLKSAQSPHRARHAPKTQTAPRTDSSRDEAMADYNLPIDQPAPGAMPHPEPHASPVPPTGYLQEHHAQPAVQQNRSRPLFDLDELFFAMLRGWKTIVLSAAISGALAYGFSRTLPEKFDSVATLLLDPRGLKVLENGVVPGDLSNTAIISYLESQMRVMSSASVLSRVIEKEKLIEAPSSVWGENWLLAMLTGGAASGPAGQLALNSLQDAIRIERGERTFVITIGASTSDPELSARIANSIASEYIETEAGAKSDAALNASTGLSSRLDELRERLRIADEQVEKYKAENKIIGAEGKLTSEVQLTKLNEQLAVAKVQTGEARVKAEQAGGLTLEDVVQGNIPTSLRSSELGQLRVRYSRLKSQADKLAVKLGNRHPDRIAADAEVASAQGEIRNEINRAIAAAKQDFKRAEARENDLNAQINVVKSQTVETNAALIKLRELERDANASRRVYEEFLLRSRETGEQGGLKLSNARLIEEAMPPLEKSGPNRKLFAAGGLVLGGMIGAALILVSAIKGLVSQHRAPVPTVSPAQPQAARREEAEDHEEAKPNQGPSQPPEREAQNSLFGAMWSKMKSAGDGGSAKIVAAPKTNNTQSNSMPNPAHAPSGERDMYPAYPSPAYGSTAQPNQHPQGQVYQAAPAVAQPAAHLQPQPQPFVPQPVVMQVTPVPAPQPYPVAAQPVPHPAPQVMQPIPAAYPPGFHQAAPQPVPGYQPAAPGYPAAHYVAPQPVPHPAYGQPQQPQPGQPQMSPQSPVAPQPAQPQWPYPQPYPYNG